MIIQVVSYIMFTMRECILSFLLQCVYTDAVLVCGSHFFSVHRLVLMACSEYFSDIFSRVKDCPKPVIVLQDIDSYQLEALLDYMYLGEVDVHQHKLTTFIKAAEALHVKGLATNDDDPTKPLKTTVPCTTDNFSVKRAHESNDSYKYDASFECKTNNLPPSNYDTTSDLASHKTTLFPFCTSQKVKAFHDERESTETAPENITERKCSLDSYEEVNSPKSRISHDLEDNIERNGKNYPPTSGNLVLLPVSSENDQFSDIKMESIESDSFSTAAGALVKLESCDELMLEASTVDYLHAPQTFHNNAQVMIVATVALR